MTEFFSLYRHDLIRIGACVPQGQVADPDFAVTETLRIAQQGDAAQAAVILFPELGLSSYAIDDLLFQDALLDAVERAIGRLADASCDLYPVLVVGAPLRCEGCLFNTAVVIHRGAIPGAVPKA